jgi:hypothetical protein
MSPADPLTLLVVERLPELRMQPEWRERAEASELSFSSFGYWILSPYLQRLVDAGDRERLHAVLQVVEDLASAPGAAADVAWLCEWGIFRRKHHGATLPLDLMGSGTRAIIEHLQALWGPWERMLDVLVPFFDQIIEAVRSHYPSLHGNWTASVRTGGTLFDAYASFMYDPAGQRYEDMLLTFSVLTDHVQYAIERGSGHGLAPDLEPATLPPPESPEYQQALLNYAEAAIEFTWENLPSVLAELADPYDLED